eukprot:1021783-Rhodomonas_salina.4
MKKKCVDINACVENPCEGDNGCTNLPAPALNDVNGRQCCPLGTACENGACVDIRRSNISVWPRFGSSRQERRWKVSSSAALSESTTPPLSLVCSVTSARVWIPFPSQKSNALARLEC